MLGYLRLDVSTLVVVEFVVAVRTTFPVSKIFSGRVGLNNGLQILDIRYPKRCIPPVLDWVDKHHYVGRISDGNDTRGRRMTPSRVEGSGSAEASALPSSLDHTAFTIEPELAGSACWQFKGLPDRYVPAWIVTVQKSDNLCR